MSIWCLVYDFVRNGIEHLFVNAVDTVAAQEILVAGHLVGRQARND